MPINLGGNELNNIGTKLLNDTSIVTSGLALYLDAGIATSYGGSGTTWTDLTSNANNGTLTNGPTYTTASGGAIVFDGTNDHIYIAPTTSTNISSTITTECWVYYISGNGRIFQKDGESYTRCWEIGGYGGQFRMEMWHSDGTGTLAYGNYLPVNNWTHLVLTFDGTNIRMYQDTVLTSTTNFPGNIRTDINTPLYLGGVWSGEYFNGRIANAKLYNRALSTTEILQNYQSQRQRFGLS